MLTKDVKNFMEKHRILRKELGEELNVSPPSIIRLLDKTGEVDYRTELWLYSTIKNILEKKILKYKGALKEWNDAYRK